MRKAQIGERFQTGFIVKVFVDGDHIRNVAMDVPLRFRPDVPLFDYERQIFDAAARKWPTGRLTYFGEHGSPTLNIRFSVVKRSATDKDLEKFLAIIATAFGEEIVLVQ
jgi:hypothetical protein